MKLEAQQALINKLAGNEYEVLDNTLSNKDFVRFRHKTCKNVFQQSINDIAKNGIICDRCFTVKNKTILSNLDTSKSIQLYNEVLAVIDKGCKVIGDTSSLDSIIVIEKKGRFYTEVKIRDLLEGTNLPDTLLHCRLTEKSIQMQMLQIFLGSRYEIIDDFTSFTDIIRVRDCTKDTIIREPVSTFVAKLSI